LLLWIKGSCSPAQLREKLLGDDADFRSRLIAWLESCHRGDFSTGNMSSVASRVCARSRPSSGVATESIPEDDEFEVSPGDPTVRLPTRPPPHRDERSLADWFSNVEHETDEIVFRSNRHSPLHNSNCKKGGRDCRARFPRPLQEVTSVDPESGGLLLKKHEQWINTYSVTLSYLLRCNSDVTCLLSGTMVRAVIAYVTDYVTKSSLKTHTMFEVIQGV
ncbi:hypothetical protein BC629DRAFT_1242344, partial [Irpex lacteus]